MTRMEPWEASPKNDIILAWQGPPKDLPVDLDCEADVRLTIDHLLVKPDQEQIKCNRVDWTQEEEQSIRTTLEGFLASNEATYVFPTRLGRRKRKLVHYVAEQMDLAHWSEGEKWGDKTVAVA